ncbi:MAG: metalloregulator ArsR/SmtB family transcription factor [Thermoplasmataceae archaeon]
MMHPQYHSDLQRTADILKILGDSNRLHILALISHQELCVCEITSILNISQSNASQHLARLRSADLVKERRSAQWIYYSLNPDAFPIIKEILDSLPDVSWELKKIEDLTDHKKCKI